jgi:plastocyanin
MRVIRILSVFAIAATFGLAAGCGGDDDDEDTAATEATTTEEAAAGGGGATEIAMTEYAFDPADVTFSRADTITVTNDGELPHNYTVPKLKGELQLRTGDVDPGSSTKFVVSLPPGKYDVICTIPGHAAQGMEGTLMVKP